MKGSNDYPYGDIPIVSREDSLSISELTENKNERVELEIGFGKGRFILDMAEANPRTYYVGLETRRKWVHLVTERASKRELSNVRVWLGDAKSVLPRIREEACLKRVFINFPDPWWKKRHQKRMVVTVDLIGQISRLLEDAGEVLVQTDVDFRAQFYMETLLSIRDLRPAGTSGIFEENPYAARSLREIRCEEIDLPIYRLLFKRKPRP